MSANYFELFGLRAEFLLKQSQLDKAYHAIQNQLHPDRHVSATTQQRRLSEQKSALANEAYRVLSDDCERADHLLSLRARSPKDQSQTADDSEFLVEQMELRQALDQSSEAGEFASLKERTDRQLQSLREDFARLYERENYKQARAAQVKMQFLFRFQKQLLERMKARELEDEPA